VSAEAQAEALRRYPPSMPVEDYDGDRYQDDEYGYDEAQRAAFIAGWSAALTEEPAA
jgi:hypothetical protein